MSTHLVTPHGGVLKPLLLKGEELTQAKTAAESLSQVRLSSRETSDLIMLAVGAFSPLDGFMVKADYEGVVENMHLADGTLWPMPITLAVSNEQADSLSLGDQVALVDDESGELMGSMTIRDKYTYDKKNEAARVFRTEDGEHPGVAKIYTQGDVYIGGPVQQNTLQFIHRSDGLIEGGIEVREGIYWGGNFEQMITMLESNLISPSDIKFFVGYSGWAAGQLKGELELNSWIISRNVNIEQIFDTDVKSLWKEVLNTMGGKFKIVANFPVDPRLN